MAADDLVRGGGLPSCPQGLPQLACVQGADAVAQAVVADLTGHEFEVGGTLPAGHLRQQVQGAPVDVASLGDLEGPVLVALGMREGRDEAGGIGGDEVTRLDDQPAQPPGGRRVRRKMDADVGGHGGIQPVTHWASLGSALARARSVPR